MLQSCNGDTTMIFALFQLDGDNMLIFNNDGPIVQKHVLILRNVSTRADEPTGQEQF